MGLFVKRKGGREYYYWGRSARVNGKPRILNQVYLGPAHRWLELHQAATQGPRQVKTFRFGAVAALLTIVDELKLLPLLETRFPAPTGGIPAGRYLLLAALGRAIQPGSKRAFAQWYAASALPHLLHMPTGSLSSQRFWDAMDLVPVEQLRPAYQAIAHQACTRFALDEQLVAFDSSNFFTYIASRNQRNLLAQRGHSKAHRTDLRQVGYAVASTVAEQVPLFYDVYPGNRPDVREFASIWADLQQSLLALGRGEATWIYDKGNFSQANQAAIDAASIPYVTSVVPSYYPDLLAVPLDQFTALMEPALQPTRAYRTEAKIAGRRRVVVMTYSPELAEDQERGVRANLTKARQRLARLRGQLRRSPKRKQAAIQRQLDRILSAQHLRRLVQVTLSGTAAGLVFRYRSDRAHFTHLKQHYFGRRLWITSQQSWSTEAIVRAARAQQAVEADFRQLHAPDHVAWQPAYHWTDQKLQVHGFYCTVALLLVQLLRLKAREVGDERSVRGLLDDLDNITEVVLAYPPTGGGRGRPRVVHTVSERSPSQARLYDALQLERWALGTTGK